MSRANGKENIFETDVDRQDFIKTRVAACGKTGFEIHAYALIIRHKNSFIVVNELSGRIKSCKEWQECRGEGIGQGTAQKMDTAILHTKNLDHMGSRFCFGNP